MLLLASMGFIFAEQAQAAIPYQGDLLEQVSLQASPVLLADNSAKIFGNDEFGIYFSDTDQNISNQAQNQNSPEQSSVGYDAATRILSLLLIALIVLLLMGFIFR